MNINDLMAHFNFYTSETGLKTILMIFIAIIAGIILSILVDFIIKRIYRKERNKRGNLILKIDNWQRPLLFLLPSLCIAIIFPILKFPGKSGSVFRHILSIWIICSIMYFGMRIITVFRRVILANYDISKKDNLQARKIVTQFKVIERIAFLGLFIISFSSILMTFERIRQIGLSLIASAGILGIVVGFAAQRTLSTIIAGIQIAITQPIRIDDVVIVEGEWGRIEEITLTYIVLRIWDQRRLVIPINHFIEKPFQNWTRTSADLIGSVFIYTDYSIPVDSLRIELKKILKNHPLWDKRVCMLQVTNTTDKSIELRALMSTEDSSKGWDLRCDVREQLIGFLQKYYPESVPKVRIENINKPV
jgi:small-conductance mechanosensitive channel